MTTVTTERELWKDYDDRQRFEHDLIDRKTSWMLASQSLLFAAFGTSGLWETSPTFFQVTVAAVGTLTSALIGFGVWMVINSKKQSWLDYQEYLTKHPDSGLLAPFDQRELQWGVRTNNTTKSLYPDRFLPWIFVLAWICLAVWAIAEGS